MNDDAQPDGESFVSRWQAALASGDRSSRVDVLVRRLGDGAHDSPAAVELDVAGGVIGDRWGAMGSPPRDGQVSIMDARVLHALVGADRSRWHVPGDNLVVEVDLSEAALPVGTRLRVGGAVLEITGKPHAGCAKFRERLGGAALAWVNAPERRGLRLRGVYARVVGAGRCAIGDVVEAL
jgi:MOSC domain-containing protein YiiM